MLGGTASLDDMIASTPRGMLVTRLWYLREVDPRTMLYTGLTRDGTFLIENGKISKAIQNFRFNESPLFMLNNLEMLGPAGARGGHGGGWCGRDAAAQGAGLQLHEPLRGRVERVRASRPPTLADPPGDRRQLHSFSGENHGCEKEGREKGSSESSSHGAEGSSQGTPGRAEGSSRRAQGREEGRAEVAASETRAPESGPEGDNGGNVNEQGRRHRRPFLTFTISAPSAHNEPPRAPRSAR